MKRPTANNGEGMFYNNAVRPVICEGWHFTHKWKELAWPYHWTKSGGLVPYN